MKTKKQYICTSCDYKSPTWVGKCPNCGEWNTFVQDNKFSVDTAKQPSVARHHQQNDIKTISTLLSELETAPEKRLYEFSTDLLNDFWNEGLVSASFTLMAGEPGLGKSTLSLQILRALRNAKTGKTIKLLYITAEETSTELARRAKRLSVPTDIDILQSNNLEYIEEKLKLERPAVAIIDSIQTVYSNDTTSSPGSVAQVSLVASRLLALSKSEHIAIIIIGHVTKDGQIAGPKTLEHLVDSVLVLEQSQNPLFRTLSFTKHRFGSTENMLLLKMEEKGLEIITDPSLALLENIESSAGTVYSVALTKNLPQIVEIQSLVNPPKEQFKPGFGQRQASGIPQTKLLTLLAIIERYVGINLLSYDIFLQLTGLSKSQYDDSLDLAVIVSIMSSLKNETTNALLKLGLEDKCLVNGRVTMNGTIRKATHEDNRIKTAKKLGFKYNPGITTNEISGLFN
jgi:DNA repair protein RadA/Sms